MSRLLVHRGGVIKTATLRDATGWDELVDDLKAGRSLYGIGYEVKYSLV